jgi:hypothetical protein
VEPKLTLKDVSNHEFASEESMALQTEKLAK